MKGLLLAAEREAARFASTGSGTTLATRVVRKAMLGLGRDPEVDATIAGRAIRLPMSHRLPAYLRAFPDYSMNVGRLAGAVGGPVIDIGANVGDTAAIIRRFSAAPILCIEGHQKFLSYLRRNVQGDADIEIAAAFIGSTTGTERRGAMEAGGTMSLTADDDSVVSFRRLDELLQDHPRFHDVRLLKSDTDGYDAMILLSVTDFLAEKRPVLFFEYDPLSLEPISGDPQQLLRRLIDIGYTSSLVYDNRGTVLLSTEPAESRVLFDLDGYIRNTDRQFYVDIAFFHDDDLDLFKSFRAAERHRL